MNAPQSPELVIIEVGLSALIGALGRKRADRLLKDMAITLAHRSSRRGVRRINSASEDRAVVEAEQAADAWFRENLPTFVARLPPDTRI